MIMFKIPRLCAVGCILRMPGSPMILCTHMVCLGRESLFENNPKYKGDSVRFSLEKSNVGLLGMCPYAPIMALDWVVTKGLSCSCSKKKLPLFSLKGIFKW